QTRRILDRLVGYKISPLLWSKVRRGLSAGRVQSVAVKIICQREDEIKKFISEEYWNITTTLEAKNPPPFEAKLHKVAGKKTKVNDETQANKIIAKIKKNKLTVCSVEKKEAKKNPPPPFTTSKLQQEAARWLRFSAKRTMSIAQRLYEGVDLGSEGSVALITYMRTDSVRITNEAIENARDYIKQNYEKEYLPDKPRHFKNSGKAQDGHEAIRPVSMDYHPEAVKSYLSSEEFRLYQLIWNRFLASQMSIAIYNQTTIDIEAGDCLLRATGSILKFAGFTTVYTEGKDDNGDESEFGKILPEISPKEIVKLIDIKGEQKFTQPPPRFTEASLVRELEENGIGRPSTYATILSTIQDREYVLLNERKFSPTELGDIVNGLLVTSFPQVLNVEFTANLEETLDKIAEGECSREETLKTFYVQFEKELKNADETMRSLKGEGEKTDLICEKCGEPMVIKFGKNGRFLACSNYPKCKTAFDFTNDESGKIVVAKPETTDVVCKLCGKEMIVRKGRFGKFLACSGYPECKSTVAIENSDEVSANGVTSAISDTKCPVCGKEMLIKRGRFGKFLGCSDYPNCKTILPIATGFICPLDGCKGSLVEKTSKRGKTFFSCSNYPKCKFATWNKPTGEKCPSCGKKTLAEKYTAKQGVSKVCLCEECGCTDNSSPAEE
ncbi:MAG: type I DNA topoisomerase, partial [Deltaproteobacteria bacterium]